MSDLQMQDAADEKGIGEQPPFSQAEKEILDLYDQVKKLELEIALAKARTRLADESAKEVGRGGHAASEDDASQVTDPKGVYEAREQLLEAMALYNLRNTVVESVLSTNPILKGIHNSTYASPIEQDIQQWIHTRDGTSHSVAKQTASLRSVLDQLIEVESEALRVSKKNAELAADVLRLARDAELNHTDAIADDPGAKEQIVQLEGRLAASKQKWRVMKGTASGIVAGSGVDWARDPELRDVVLDPE